MKSPKKVPSRHYWTTEVRIMKEDKLLIKLVSGSLGQKWKNISKEFSSSAGVPKTSKQCRDRWLNYLSPRVKNVCSKNKGIPKLFSLQLKFGNKWTVIAEHLPGWGPNTLKNKFYSTIRRNIRKFNKDKKPEECIRGNIGKLLEIQEIRTILTARKSMKAKDFSAVKLTEKTMEIIQEMNGIDNRQEGEVFTNAYLCYFQRMIQFFREFYMI
jgi:hypothetical protein